MTSEQEQNQSVQAPIPSYLVWSIISTVLCCLPTGIYAIILSSKANTLASMGQIDEAKKFSNQAKKWVLISVVVGIIVQLIPLLIYFFSVAVNVARCHAESNGM